MKKKAKEEETGGGRGWCRRRRSWGSGWAREVDKTGEEVGERGRKGVLGWQDERKQQQKKKEVTEPV